MAVSQEQTINAMMESHPRLKAENQVKATQILSAFSQWITQPSFSDWHFGLYRFAVEKPLCYFEAEAVDEALSFFRANQDHTLHALLDTTTELSQAVLAILRPGISWGKEGGLSIDRPEGILEFEQIWHPEYLRYCEHIFNHIIQIPLLILDQLKGKKYSKDTHLSIRADALRNHGLSKMVCGFDPVVRNAISHGHIRFGLMNITYEDSGKPPKTLDADEFAGLFDALVDTCHSLLIALLLFICEKKEIIEKEGLEKIPLGFRYAIIEGYTFRRDLHLEYFVESQSIDKSQLNLIYRVDTTNRAIQRYETVHLCWLACRLGGKKYNRYFVGVNCGLPSLAIIAINGDKLRNVVENDMSLQDGAPGLIESELLWFDSSSLSAKIYSLRNIFIAEWQHGIAQFQYDIEKRGVRIWRNTYKILDTRNTSPRKLPRLEVVVSLRLKGRVTDSDIVKIVKHIVKRMRQKRVRIKDQYGEKGLPKNPRFITICVYSEERRLRRLVPIWTNPDLVLIAEWCTDWNLYKPLYTREQTHYADRNLRIKLNAHLVNTTPET